MAEDSGNSERTERPVRSRTLRPQPATDSQLHGQSLQCSNQHTFYLTQQTAAKHSNTTTTPHPTAANIWNYAFRVYSRHTSAPPVHNRHKQLATSGNPIHFDVMFFCWRITRLEIPVHWFDVVVMGFGEIP